MLNGHCPPLTINSRTYKEDLLNRFGLLYLFMRLATDFGMYFSHGRQTLVSFILHRAKFMAYYHCRFPICNKLLYCIVLHCIVLYCIVSYRIVSYRIASHRIASHRIALHRSTEHRIALHVLYCRPNSAMFQNNVIYLKILSDTF